MQSAVAVVFLVSVLVAFVYALPQQTYTTKYDNMDVDKILSSRRLVNNYVQCLTDKKPCSPEGTELKKALPDAIKTRCAKCNDVQRQKAIKVIRKLQKDYPAEWKTLLNKWDPNGNLMKEFEQELSKRN